MAIALVVSSNGPAAPPLVADLEAVGVETTEMSDCTRLVQTVLKMQPDVVICFEQAPNAAFFGNFETLATTAARPVVVFTPDPDADKIDCAARSGVHAYIVDGYGRHRLRAIMHLSQARFAQEEALRRELVELRTRFEERKLVDRAKGILMAAQQLREEDAFSALRTTAMASKQRIGQVSQIVIDRARFAEAMNRAGQLRMLSQRLVKWYALGCGGAAIPVKPLLGESVAQMDATLASLHRLLSKRTFGDLVTALAAPWERLKRALALPQTLAALAELDRLAEECLGHAERLTTNLEIAAYAPALGVINTVGRQRMLSQRLAKQSILQSLAATPASAAMRDSERTLAEFLAGLDYLTRLPLSNADIARELAATGLAWTALEQAMSEAGPQGATMRVAEASEVLLGHFDRLTDLLERGIQAFAG